MKKSMNAIKSIRTCLNDYTCGWKNSEALTVIAKAVGEIQVEAGSHDYVREKLGSLNGWADKLYSPRKHAPWGIEMVRHFILCDCDGVKMYLERFRKEAS
jgi:hypothetical protein